MGVELTDLFVNFPINSPRNRPRSIQTNKKMAAQFGSSPCMNKLNDFLLTRSYIDGWTVSGEDVALFKKVSKPSNSHQNALRWWNHINSFAAVFNGLESELKSVPAAAPAAADDDEDDDDDDFFASSDEEDEEAAKAAEELKAKRIAEYNARKAAKEEKKGKVIAKSSITFDVKPWDDETDLDVLCGKIKAIEKDKVGSDDLIEEIEAFEDEVQSVDVAAFQKI